MQPGGEYICSITLCCNSHAYDVCSNPAFKTYQRAKKEFIVIYQRKGPCWHIKKCIFPALGGSHLHAPLCLCGLDFHSSTSDVRKVCHMLPRAHHQALHPSTWHQSLLAHVQSHGGPTLTTVLDYDDTFVSEERAALGHRHHFEPISRLRLLLCAGGWPTVTNFFFSSALVFRKELRSALYFNSDLRFNDHPRNFSQNFCLQTDKSLHQRTMPTLKSQKPTQC